MAHTIYKRPKDDMSDDEKDAVIDYINKSPPKFTRQQSKFQRSMIDALATTQSVSHFETSEGAKKAMIKQCIKKVDLKYPQEISNIIHDAAENQYDFEDFWNDIYEADGEWSNSAIMQEVADRYDDEEVAERLFAFMFNFLSGLDQDDDDVDEFNLTLPNDINFDIPKAEEAIEEVREFLDMLCPDAGFTDTASNKDLLKAFAIGHRNGFPVLSYIMDMFELSLMSHSVNSAKNALKAEQKQDNHEAFSFAPNNSDDEWKGWMKQCQFNGGFEKGVNIIKLAIGSFKTRLIGNTFGMPFWSRIEDDINVYIEYILRLNEITSNIMTEIDKVYPFQIEVVIIGKEHGLSKPMEDAKESNDDEEDDDAIFDHLYVSGNDKQNNNPLPQHGMEKFLKCKGLKLSKSKISLKDKNVNTVIQDAIIKQIGNRSHQRVIVVIDRSEKRGNQCDDNQDMLYIFQLPKHDTINKDYNENDIHMSWMTKRYIFPAWSKDDQDTKDIMKYFGGGTDFGDNAFVFSFHVHKDNKVKCELFIKQHKLPFLPHHMVDIWPIYFAPRFRKVNQKYSKEYIYENWKVPSNNKTLMAWIKYIDPNYYTNLKKEHLEYQNRGN